MERSKNLFHYTDVGAVKSILENCELWLTDIRFLNDSQELHDGVAYVLEELASDSYGVGAGEYLESAREMLSSEIRDHVTRYINIEPTFVCSFSEVGNQLSQWRAYGRYAIEFDRELIDIDLFHCVYNQSEKRKEAEGMVSPAVYGVAAECMDNQGAYGPESMRYLATLVRIASTFKDESFHEEQEVRCAVDVLLPSASLKFRERNGLLVPYVAQKIPFEAIKAVHVGPMPNQELACTALKAFVSSLPHKRSSETGDVNHKIDIVMSNIPFRAI